MWLIVVVLPAVVLLGFLLTLAVRRRRYGAIASFVLGVTQVAWTYGHRNSLDLKFRLDMGDSDILSYLLVCGAGGVAFYAVFSGVQELFRGRRRTPPAP